MRGSQNISSSMIDLIHKKGLPEINFEALPIKLEDDISKHSQLAYQLFYQYPFVSDPLNIAENDMPRPDHGIIHVGRVAFDVTVLINIFRLHSHPQIEQLTEEDLKLLQITAILHDCAREADGIDVSDEDSARILYHYLTRTLKVPHLRAVLFAEALANKDVGIPQMKPYRSFNRETNLFEDAKSTPSSANIYQKILHDADALDVRRVRQQFIGEYLYFFQDIVKTQPHALQDMTRLIKEVQFLLEEQGDDVNCRDSSLKKPYFNEHCYSRIVKMINGEVIDNKHPKFQYNFLRKFYGNNRLIPLELLRESCDKESKEEKRTASEDIINTALQSGLVVARSVRDPSAQHPKHPMESLICEELIKTGRRPNVPTRTNRTLKFGNHYRSVNVLNGQIDPFGNAGFLIVNPNLKQIQAIALSNLNSGFHKKSDVFSRVPILKASMTLSSEEKQKQLTKLIYLQAVGGARAESKKEETTTSPEILMHITYFDAIFFSQGSNLTNKLENKKPYIHPASAILQAIYIQNECKKPSNHPVFEHLDLPPPLVEYFPQTGRVRERTFSDEQILQMWKEMCQDYITRAFERFPSFNSSRTMDRKFKRFYIDSLSDKNKLFDEIKIKAMYGGKRTLIRRHPTLMPADNNYSDTLKAEIYNSLEDILKKSLKDRENVMVKELVALLKSGKGNSIFGAGVIPIGIVSWLILSPSLIVDHQELNQLLANEIKVQLEIYIKNGYEFTNEYVRMRSSAMLNSFYHLSKITGIFDSITDMLRNLGNKVKQEIEVDPDFRDYAGYNLKGLCAMLNVFQLEDLASQLNDVSLTRINNIAVYPHISKINEMKKINDFNIAMDPSVKLQLEGTGPNNQDEIKEQKTTQYTPAINAQNLSDPPKVKPTISIPRPWIVTPKLSTETKAPGPKSNSPLDPQDQESLKPINSYKRHS